MKKTVRKTVKKTVEKTVKKTVTKTAKKRDAEGWHGWDDYAAFYDWENARTGRTA